MKTRLLFILCILLMSIGIQAHDLEPLHVDGRYLKNSKGDIVTLHGYMTVLEPGCQADEFRSTWDGYNVAMCLKNKKAALDAVLKSGWKMDYVRFKLDSYWCCNQLTYNGDEYKSFDFERFKKYFEDLFLPLLDYYHEKGIYTLLFPPHTTPGTIEHGDEFLQHMMLLWNYVSSHPRIKNNPGVMFELANEPINFNCHQGDFYDGYWGFMFNISSAFREVRDYWQPIVDKIRSHCDNVIYVPGMLYESDHAGFADYPVQGGNIGYAVHWYPGWWGNMRKDWEQHIFPIAYKAPIIITENAWAPYSNYLGGGPDASTSNFGRPLKNIIDELGNVSWNCYEPEEDYYYLVNSSSSSEKAVIANDPEACFKSMYQWWNEYANTKVMSISQLKAKKVSFDSFPTVLAPGQKVLAKIKAEYTNGMIWDVSGDAEYIIADESVLSVDHGVIWSLKDGSTSITVKYTDGTGQVFSRQFEVTSTLFPLTAQGFNPNLHDDNGSFNESTGDYSTVSYNTGGWSYGEGLDLTPYKYIVVQLNREEQCWATVRIWDDENVWSDNEAWDDKRGYAGFTFNNETELVIDLQTLHKQNGESLDLSHIYHIGIWINGELGSVSIKRVFLSNDGVTPANSYQEPICVYADNKVMFYGDEVPALTFSTSGPYIEGTPKLSTTANSASSVGVYPITLEKGTVTNEQANYIDGTLTVMKAPLMVGVEDVTINEGDAIPSFTLTYSGFRNGDTESNAFSTKPTATTTATSSSSAGTYPITISGGVATNYSLTYTQGTLTIKAKESPSTWTNIVVNNDLEGNDVSCFYMRENYAVNDAVVPATIVNGVGKNNSRGIMVQSVDNPADTWNTQFFVRLPQTIPAGTKYRLSFDYKASREAYVLMEIHAEPSDFIYYGFDQMTFNTTWQHYESEGTITGEMSPEENKMRTIAFDLAHEKTATAYYFDNIVFEIEGSQVEQPVIITANDLTMIYGDEVPKLTYSSYGATLYGTPQLSTTATKTSPVGTYPIKVEKGTVTNEAVTYVDGTLTITQAPLTVGVQNVTITEGDAIPSFTLTYSGFRNGDTESNTFTTKPTATTTATSSSKAGIYPITVSGGTATNYALTYTQGTLTIKEKPKEPVTITANEITMVYGDEVPTLTYSTEGGTLKGTPKLSTTATKTSPIGTYPIKVERGTVTNEKVTFVDGMLIISKAPLTIGVKDETITEGDSIPTFTLIYDGWRNGDTEATAFTRKPKAKTTATSESKAGTYPITITKGTAKNYKISYEEGTLTIEPAAGIESVYADGQGNAVIYNVNGQKLSKPRKGINIIGGKKVVVK